LLMRLTADLGPVRTLRRDGANCYSSWAPREEQPQVRVAE
jgi:hypothetical protein